mmetsp:Transcript_39117/g.62592  ORF Transcript_39117/g.62592 Transcript_39117/m.62592 type:complete len:444 (-) Transcript_39117:17-1348(-)
MDIAGQWHYVKWFGGGCTITHEDAGFNKLLFVEGKFKIHLLRTADGWWESGPGSARHFHLHRDGPHLVMLVRRGKRLVQVRASRSSLAAACLCYVSVIRGIFISSPPATLPLAVASASSGAKLAQESWPEPEADCSAEQPSITPVEQNSLCLLMNPDVGNEGEENRVPSIPHDVILSDEKLVQRPQTSPYCFGVSSLTTPSLEDTSVEVPLGVNVTGQLFTDMEIIAQASNISEGTGSQATSRGDDLWREEFEMIEDDPPLVPLMAPRVADAAERDKHSSNDSDQHQTDDFSNVPEERAFPEIMGLRTTIHGLLSVPEESELPDVPSKSPSKSDASILHGGSVPFETPIIQPIRVEHIEMPPATPPPPIFLQVTATDRSERSDDVPMEAPMYRSTEFANGSESLSDRKPNPLVRSTHVPPAKVNQLVRSTVVGARGHSSLAKK